MKKYVALLTSEEEIDRIAWYLVYNGYPIEWKNKFSFFIDEDFEYAVDIILNDEGIPHIIR